MCRYTCSSKLIPHSILASLQNFISMLYINKPVFPTSIRIIDVSRFSQLMESIPGKHFRFLWAWLRFRERVVDYCQYAVASWRGHNEVWFCVVCCQHALVSCKPLSQSPLKRITGQRRWRENGWWSCEYQFRNERREPGYLHWLDQR